LLKNENQSKKKVKLRNAGIMKERMTETKKKRGKKKKNYKHLKNQAACSTNGGEEECI
jgi:hypothetical protein